MKRIVAALGAISVLLAGCVALPTGALSVTPGAATPLAAATSPTVAAGQAAGEGFAIYLTADALSVTQMQAAALGQVRPAPTPLIAPADILAYRQATHELELTPAAYERIRKLKVPVNGVPFLVCVDRQSVYWGAFWTLLSSLSFDGVVILLPLESSGNSIRIGLGYPGPAYSQGPDPRVAPEIWQALERAGKLQ